MKCAAIEAPPQFPPPVFESPSIDERMMTECALAHPFPLSGERPNLRPRRLPLHLPGHEDLPQLVLHSG